VTLSTTFSLPSLNLELPTDDIHVWYAALDVSSYQFEILSKLLSKDEWLRAERFHFEQDRNHFIVCRGILRSILGTYLGSEPGQLQFCYGENGKPALFGRTDYKMIRFNLSHSGGLAMYAFAMQREIGIDIEEVRNISDMAQIAKSNFSVNEYNVLCTLTENKFIEAFYNCWTRKEAFIKAAGDGLSMPLDSFDVSLVPGEPARLISIQGDYAKAEHWSLQALSPGSDFIGALAVEGKYRQIAYWRWDTKRIREIIEPQAA
jgi:4'-phosphopantetheinyl transferase